MKTLERGHDDVLPLNSAGRNLAHYLYAREHREEHWTEKFATFEVVVPLLIVVITLVTMAVQYILLSQHGHLQLPTFVDIPLAMQTGAG